MHEARVARACAAALACALMVSASPVLAQAIHKCVRAGQPPVYQSEPCSGAARTARTLSYTPDPTARPYRPDVRARPYARAGGGATVVSTRTQASESACDAARQRRDIVLGRNNQGGNIDLRRALNDEVQRACY